MKEMEMKHRNELMELVNSLPKDKRHKLYEDTYKLMESAINMKINTTTEGEKMHKATLTTDANIYEARNITKQGAINDVRFFFAQDMKNLLPCESTEEIEKACNYFIPETVVV